MSSFGFQVMAWARREWPVRLSLSMMALIWSIVRPSIS